MEPKNININNAWQDVAGYSKAVKTGSYIHVSGTTATDEQGRIIGLGDPYTQTKQILKNIESALNMLGANIEDVVRTRIYVTNIDRWQQIGKAYSEVFANIKPASSMVEVSRLISRGTLVEIEADAIVNNN